MIYYYSGLKSRFVSVCPGGTIVLRVDQPYKSFAADDYLPTRISASSCPGGGSQDRVLSVLFYMLSSLSITWKYHDIYIHTYCA